MKAIFLLVMALAISACGQSKSREAGRTPQPAFPSPTQSEPNFPEPNFPESNFPEATFPEATFPEATFPEATFPEVTFPEVTFPEVKVQSGDGKIIYTLPADILFDFDKATLRTDAEAALQQISASIAQRSPDASLQINGYTDAVGEDAYNLELSKQRAESVSQWLVTNAKTEVRRIRTQGLGEAQPVAPNTHADGSDNPAGRQQNRRVEIVVLAP